MLVIGLIALVLGGATVAMIFVFKNVMKTNLASATSHLEHLHEEYTKKEQEAEQRLQESQAQAAELLQQAQAQAESTRAEVVKLAQEEKESLLREARSQAEDIMRQADRARQQLLNEIEQRIQKQAAQKACALVGSSLPEDFKKDVHARWMNDLLESGFQETAHLKLPENEKEVKVVSAFDLSSSDKSKIAQKLSERLGKELSIKTETDQSLVAGIMICIGSVVLDGSLQHKIQERAL